MSAKEGNLQAPKRAPLDWKTQNSTTRHPCMPRWSASSMSATAAGAALAYATHFPHFSTLLTNRIPLRSMA